LGKRDAEKEKNPYKRIGKNIPASAWKTREKKALRSVEGTAGQGRGKIAAADLHSICKGKGETRSVPVRAGRRNFRLPRARKG